MTDDYAADFALWTCLLLNGTVFVSAWWFVTRRAGVHGSQGVFDAGVLGFVVQYLSVGVPGLLHVLTGPTVFATAMIFSAALFVAGFRRPPAVARPPADFGPAAVVVVSFTIALFAGFAVVQAGLPVISNDALTYHFPAAAQWIQRHEITPFQTWFFNPANTYSPLAGSAYVVWWALPFGTDVAARFVEVPALLLVMLGVYRLCRETGAGATSAAFISSAAVLSGPVFAQEMMGKDDLFVAAFFLAAAVASSKHRAHDRFAASRLGVCVGMMLATKYTALLAAPLLLLAVDLRFQSRPTRRQWAACFGWVAALAGPWYLANLLRFGNPCYPTSFLGLPGLFTTAASDALRHLSTAAAVVSGGTYALSHPLAAALGLGFVSALIAGGRPVVAEPLQRLCVFGPVVGVVIFYAASPFPEVRFLLPTILLLLAATAIPVRRFFPPGAAILFAVAAATLWSVSQWRGRTGQALLPLLCTAIAVSACVSAAAWMTRRQRPVRRGIVLGGPALLGVAVFAFVHWTAYSTAYVQSLSTANPGYRLNYPAEAPAWEFVAGHVPADATLAYTDTYLVYPLQGPRLSRRVVYVPTRRGLLSVDGLPYLGTGLTGELVVGRAVSATVADPDSAWWHRGLKACGATFLFVGRDGSVPRPIEKIWADADPAHFRKLFESAGATVYAIGPW